MEPTSAGELVKVAAGGPELDGIVFDTPSHTKVVVAVVDPARGPIFRTVHPDTLSERETEGSADAALRALIRRTPAPAHRSSGDAQGGVHGSRGFGRAAMHRTTGK